MFSQLVKDIMTNQHKERKWKMLFKPLYEPVELKLLRFLNSRMNLAAKEKQYFFNLEKGYEGERKLAALLEHLSIDLIILNDLLLEHNNSIFQIDTLLISQNTIYLFEVKNYEGDFYIDAEIWYKKSGNEIKNPLLQLKRSESLL
jgi:Nuclease-related domain